MSIINILMDGDKSVCCFFKKKKYTLTIIAENGTVSGAGVYDAKTEVTVQATPNTGYQFDHWSGDLSGNINPTTILMNSNKTITAHFVKIQYTLTTSVDPADSGTITGAGTYPEGMNVEVEATPTEDYEFNYWEINGQTVNEFILGIDVLGVGDGGSNFGDWLTDIYNAGFRHIKLGSVDWDDPYNNLNRYKNAVLQAKAMGFDVYFGLSSTNVNLNATNYVDYENAVLSLAQWAEDNGLPEFKIGNEEEMHINGITIQDLIVRLKATATKVKQIYSGKVIYTCFQNEILRWVDADKGDIDILASNIYYGWNDVNPCADDDGLQWNQRIDKLVESFGVDGTQIGEIGVNSSGMSHYSADEAEIAVLTMTMINYAKTAGMKRVYFFMYRDISWLTDFGAKDINGNERIIWNRLLLEV